jgi:tetratricopeptide (TPR) repeat protein
MTIEQAFAMALEQQRFGRLAEAERICRQILARDSEHADAIHLLGMIAAQAGQIDAGMALIERAIQLRPNWPEAIGNLGNALALQDRLEAAAAAYRRAIEIQRNPQLFYNLAKALQEMGNGAEAIGAYREAIALQPGFAEAHINLAGALKGAAQLDEAIVVYQKAIALRPDCIEAYCNLGNVLEAKGRLDDALAVYRQGMAVKPEEPAAYNNLMLGLLMAGRADGAGIFGDKKDQAERESEKILDDVTLLCIDCVDPAAAAKVLERRGGLKFGAVKLLTHEKPAALAPEIEWVPIPKIESLRQYNHFVLRQLNRYVETSHVLSIQTDGYILNPGKWNDSWLHYDYIGAPWIHSRWNRQNRVGNSGFCLRSRRLLEATARWSEPQYSAYTKTTGYWLDDVVTCCVAFADLCRDGLRFAPLDVAAMFSFEDPIPEILISVDDVFGFHRNIRKLLRPDVHLRDRGAPAGSSR